jgi:hypothetical protein
MGFRLFSRCPCIETQDGKLLAKSSWWAYMACLGLYSTEVAVDTVHRKVIVACRFFWFFQTKRFVSFNEIRCIAYDYQGPSGSALVRWLTDDDEEEAFSVSLRLEDQTVIPLFSFFGNRWGTQEEESKNYVEQLSKMIGVPVSR